MKFQNVADSISAMTCIVSVQKLADGGRGEIRIVTGNSAYIDSIEKPLQEVELLTRKFVPNSLYTGYLTRDLNFEDYCYRAAVEKKCLHSYAHPERYDVWFNMTFLPLWPDDGDLCYCAYIMEINFEPSSERISNVSGHIASAVLETAIALREAKDFQAAMKKTVADIRSLCEAEYCCLLLVNDKEKTCKVLGESFSDSSNLRPSDNYLERDFYPIAQSWKDTISGSNCLIVKDEKDMEVVAQRNPPWCQSLREAGIRTIALFPLKSRNELLGYMWASNFQPDRSTQIKEIMELTTFVLGSETGNYLMVDRLRVLGSRDMLTGVMNRNEMNNYVDKLSTLPEADKVSVGIIFADLNGLKRINDSQGHSAGDALLRNAANALRELFDDGRIFRAGGDEFVVILTDTSAQHLKEMAERIRETAGKYPNVSFAIGWCYEEDSRNIHHTLTTADALMYEDKRRYHSRESRT